MIRSQLFLITLFALLTSHACGPTHNSGELPGPLSDEEVLQHIEVLASDEFGGRTPGTVYEEMTVAYITGQFQELGIEPGMPDGSYTQDVPLMGQTTQNVELSLHSGERQVPLAYQDEAMAWPAHIHEEVDVSDAELVYVGYGIVAPEEDWDDFKGTDVSGKILVFKNYNPITHGDLFDGGNRLYYGRWTYKFEQAIEQGALGALIIHTDETAGYGWDVVRNSWSRERLFVFNEEEPATRFNGWLTRERSQELFEMAGLNFQDMLDAAESPFFEPIPLTNVQMDASMTADYRSIKAQNVVGKIEGSDPVLADEAVVFSAHHDHLGIGSPVDGDSIFNGAWDNASGVSLLLNLGRLYQLEPNDIRRSLYFVTVTAEESGLLGSHYFAQNLPLHAGKISANINLDATNIFGKTEDFVAIGYGRSNIDDILMEEAEALGRTIKPDPRPEQGIYYRSDHFSFARVGIPALYPNPGTEYVDKPDDYSEQVAANRSKIYHSVHDEIHDWWDLSGAIEDFKLVYRVALRIANHDELRQWTPGDEFEEARRQALEDAQSL
ncbi:MAG: M28 family peptidase [Bacteroidota bacterium]